MAEAKHIGRPHSLTHEQVHHAKVLLEAQWSLRAIARHFGVDHKTVSKAIVRRYGWTSPDVVHAAWMDVHSPVTLEGLPTPDNGDRLLA